MIASVLIPTTPERVEIFTRLYNELHHQLEYMRAFHPTLGEIEILTDGSKRFLDGGLSIGKKREALVKRAKGKYCWFLDSDESIAPNYLETLVRLCIQDKDVCTFRSISRFDNYWTIVDMSLRNKENEQSTPDRIVKRTPWHICPVRTEYAHLYDFGDINFNEDWYWFENVLLHCQTEAHTDAVIHGYNHSSRTSESDNIRKHEIQSK